MLQTIQHVRNDVSSLGGDISQSVMALQDIRDANSNRFKDLEHSILELAGGSGGYLNTPTNHVERVIEEPDLDIDFDIVDLPAAEPNNEDRSDELRQLAALGFTNQQLNTMLLELYSGDVEAVVRELEELREQVHNQ